MRGMQRQKRKTKGAARARKEAHLNAVELARRKETKRVRNGTQIRGAPVHTADSTHQRLVAGWGGKGVGAGNYAYGGGRGGGGGGGSGASGGGGRGRRR